MLEEGYKTNIYQENIKFLNAIQEAANSVAISGGLHFFFRNFELTQGKILY